jgi:hypothetical protein
MNRILQIYFNAVSGALGGLIGWFIVGSVSTGEWNILIAYTFVGAGVGLCIGMMTGAVTGLVVRGSLPRAVLGAALGAIAGLISGMLGLLIGEGVFLALGGGVIGRSLGWTLLGLFLGIGDGVTSLKIKRASYGAIGGLLAGMVGGLIYEAMTQLFLSQSDTVQMIVGAFGLILIGACLGGIIPLSIEIIGELTGRGTLQVLNGRRKDLVVSVIDSVTLGSYDGCEVYLPGDPGIAKKHVVVYKGAGGFFVRDLGTERGTAVGNKPVPSQSPGQRLRSGDQIRVGQTVVLFR